MRRGASHSRLPFPLADFTSNQKPPRTSGSVHDFRDSLNGLAKIRFELLKGRERPQCIEPDFFPEQSMDALSSASPSALLKNAAQRLFWICISLWVN